VWSPDEPVPRPRVVPAEESFQEPLVDCRIPPSQVPVVATLLRADAVEVGGQVGGLSPRLTNFWDQDFRSS
jgi:hypothetical protein